MTFLELKLAMAIWRNGDVKDKLSHRGRIDLARNVMASYLEIHEDSYFPFSIDEIAKLAVSIRKGSAQTKCEIAYRNGAECFFRNRNKGPCCGDVEAGHLVPACKGGKLTVANGVIECRAHNNQRREMTIEEYLVSEKKTHGNTPY